MKNRNIFVSAIGVLVLAIVIYFVWAAFMKASQTAKSDIQGGACPTDSAQCSDGTQVGRSGPNCQFVCPIGTSTAQTATSVVLEASIGHPASGLGVQVMPLSVIQDSRCPIDVQCIQAGTVQVRAGLTSASGTGVQIFMLNTPITTEAEIVTLISVSPEKESKKNILPTDYKFVFKVVKK